MERIWISDLHKDSQEAQCRLLKLCFKSNLKWNTNSNKSLDITAQFRFLLIFQEQRTFKKIKIKITCNEPEWA